jgi:hypothetical protein
MAPKTSNTQKNADDPPVQRASGLAQQDYKDAAVRIARDEERRRLEEREPRGLLDRLANWIRGRHRAR